MGGRSGGARRVSRTTPAGRAFGRCVRFRARVLAVSLAGALPLCHSLWQPVLAANPPVDAGLLEFLGSVDSDDEDWHQYLAAAGRARNPVDPPRSDGPAGNPAASGNKPAGSSGSSSDGPSAQHPAPSPSQPGGPSGANSQSRPPEVNQT
jgi:hypothetical protein